MDRKKELRNWAFFALAAFLAAGLAFFLSGCGHNMICYGDGIMLEGTFNPDALSLGVTCRYGKILTVYCRDNTEIEMQGAGSGTAGADAKQAGAQSTGSVKVKIGPQVTGYYVDALKAGAAPGEMLKYARSAEE